MINQTRVRVLAALLVGGLMATGQAQTTWYVDDDAPNDPGSGDPTVSDPLEDGSQEHPFDAIQEGIEAASDGETVLVFDGTYTGDGNRDLDFGGRLITLRSENGPDRCVIDCEASGRAFHFHTSETPESLLDGFTLTNGDAVRGGGIWCIYFSDPTIANCVIAGNNAWYGGGICCQSASPAFVNCAIVGNTAAGTSWPFGAGGYCEQSNVTFTNCRIMGNTTENDGGGLCSRNSSDLTLTNCLFAENESSSGAGLWIYGFSSATLVNCTITGNRASWHGGGISCYGYSPTITNCIVWNNSPDQIFVTSGQPLITYSDIQGGWPGPGNTDANPQFVDPADGDYHLSSGSPCVDAACNWAVPTDTADLDADGDSEEMMPLDLDGEGRLFDDPDTADTGCGNTPIVDMGAYEFGDSGPQQYFGDLDNDRDVDLADLGALLANYGNSEGCAGDLDCDGDVDQADLVALLAVYGMSCD